MTTDLSQVSADARSKIDATDEPTPPEISAGPPNQPLQDEPALPEPDASAREASPASQLPEPTPATAQLPPKRPSPPAIGGGGPLSTALERLKAQAAARPSTSHLATSPSSRQPAQPEDAQPKVSRPVESQSNGSRQESPKSAGAKPEAGRREGRRPESGKTASRTRPGSDRGPRRDFRDSPREPAEPAQPEAKVPTPSRRDPLSPEMELELEAALAGTSMDDLVGAAAPPGAGDMLEVESRHWSTVVKIHGDNVFFSLGGPNEGVASLRQFQEPPPVGGQVEVMVRGYHAEDGLYEVTVPGGSVDVHDWSDVVEGAVVEARVTGSNVGGLECMVGAIRGFIPASQVELHRVEQYSEYYDKKLLCVVTEANERRRNLVLSHRALLEREKEESREKLLEELEVGQVREGVVTSVRDFGAFVDLGGVDGLVHISQLSWDHVTHPSEVLQPGQKVRVKVEKVDLETGKIGLSYRELLERPWATVDQQFPLNSTVKGVVTRTAKFGAFVKIASGIEGLIHISELAHHRVVQVNSVVREGEEVEVKVLSVDKENQRIGLSLKAAHPLPDVGVAVQQEQEEEPERAEPIVKPRQGPLRGGREGASGGEPFGLNW